jgi:hypothetical protein
MVVIYPRQWLGSVAKRFLKKRAFFGKKLGKKIQTSRSFIRLFIKVSNKIKNPFKLLVFGPFY